VGARLFVLIVAGAHAAEETASIAVVVAGMMPALDARPFV
jgi:hypothetical protein